MSEQIWRPVADCTFGKNDTITISDNGEMISVCSAYGNGQKQSAMIPLPPTLRLCEAVDMPHADWGQAPEWAMWWAVDADGWSDFYEFEPQFPTERYYKSIWIKPNDGHRRYAGHIDIPLGVDWRLLKQKRPAA